MIGQNALAPLQARKDSLTDMAFNAIRDAIVHKQFSPGAPLSERSLATQLNVSKTPVREALLRLQHMRLVQPTPRGMRVTPVSEGALLRAYEVRAALEAHTARLAASRASQDDISAILDASRATARPRSQVAPESENFPGFYSPDRDFHMLIARASNNTHLERLCDDAFTTCWVLRQRDVEDIVFPDEVGEQHSRIAAAIQQQNPDAAATEMLQHIDSVCQRFVSHFQRAK